MVEGPSAINKQMHISESNRFHRSYKVKGLHFLKRRQMFKIALMKTEIIIEADKNLNGF